MRQMVIEIRDKDGVMPHNAATLLDALKGTREYLRNLMGDVPADVMVGAQSTAKAFEPLDWLIEEAVICDAEKGGWRMITTRPQVDYKGNYTQAQAAKALGVDDYRVSLYEDERLVECFDVKLRRPAERRELETYVANKKRQLKVRDVWFGSMCQNHYTLSRYQELNREIDYIQDIRL